MSLLALSACNVKATSKEEFSSDSSSFSIDSSSESPSIPSQSSSEAQREDLISLYSENSKLYIESLKPEDSGSLKTYRHKNFGEVPYVRIDEFCDLFPLTSIKTKRQYEFDENKFVVSNNGEGTFTIDAKNDTIVASKDAPSFYKDSRCTNNGVPLDIYRSNETKSFVNESEKTEIFIEGKERTYDLKKYNFDVVYENNYYYAPFSLLNTLFLEPINDTCIYNGSDYFDTEFITGESPTAQYCYSSNGNFLLDLSGGKLGAALFKKMTPEANEEYHFETVIEASGQRIIFSLANGQGYIKSYNEAGKLIEDDVIKKVLYEVKDNLIIIRYFSVFEEKDTIEDAISEVYTLTVHLDETFFGKKTRSQAIADFTYQELRFKMYECYGKTLNTAVKDFDNFIKDKEYKDGLKSLDCEVYDDAMSRFLLEGIDDVHTKIGSTSIFNLPILSNSNRYATKYLSHRYDEDVILGYRREREELGLSEGLDIVGKTAFVTFDSFTFNSNKGQPLVKGINEYKSTNPKDYVSNNSLEFFASSFNKIQEHSEVKNVVIDLSCNTGGKVVTIPYLLSYLTNDPTIVNYNAYNDSYNKFHYEVDLDQDGKYATESDTFKGKYKFYVLISDASFSCGNHFPTICQDFGLATILKKKSAGGSCVISHLSNSSGYQYNSSSGWVCMKKENNTWINNDAGVVPDYPVDHSLWFDHAGLNAFINNLNN